MRLDGQVAIVTGAASGFGRGIAEAYVREGARVVIADIDAAGAAALARQLGPGTLAQRCDVTRRADIDAAIALAHDHFGGVDILVNNAGATHTNQSLLSVTEAEFDWIYAVNVKAIYHATLAIVPAFARRGGGVILNTASTAGVRPRPGLTWYNGSKGAVITLTRSMAAELAPLKIRVNAINPVIGETALLEQFMGAPDSAEIRAKFIAGIPLGRMSTPADVANAALFLAEPASNFITGVCLDVDGGRCV
jgi:3-oxoacyl-[acyl-carrier protein] reductase